MWKTEWGVVYGIYGKTRWIPKADNTPAGKESQIGEVVKSSKRERELSRIMEKLYTPNENISMGELEDVIKSLLSLDLSEKSRN